MKPFTLLMLSAAMLPMCSCVVSTDATGTSVSSLFSAIGRDVITASDEMANKQLKIDNFNAVQISNIVDVVYTQRGGACSLRLEAPSNLVQYVTVSNEDGTINIGMKDGYNYRIKDKQHICCYITAPDLNKIDVSGTGDFDCQSMNTDNLSIFVGGTGDVDFKNLKCRDLSINIGGTGDVDIANLTGYKFTASVGGTGDVGIKNMDVTSAKATIGGTGDIELAGTAANAEFFVGGTGDIKARKLSAKNVSANVSGTGDIECTATASIQAATTLAGSIRYWGSPAKAKVSENVEHVK